MDVNYRTVIAVALAMSSFYAGEKLGEYRASPQNAACSNDMIDVRTQNGQHYEFRMEKGLCIFPDRKTLNCLEQCLEK